MLISSVKMSHQTGIQGKFVMQVFRLPYQAKRMFDLCNYHEDKINIAGMIIQVVKKMCRSQICSL